MDNAPGDDSVQHRIDAHLPDLPAAQRKVAVFIAENHTRIGYLSASTIGRLAGTSDATVIRTAQGLGYDGLSELKQAVAAELADPTLSERLRTALDVDDDLPTREMVAVHIEGLHRLLAPSRMQAAQRAASALVGADRVFLMGSGPTGPIAAYGAELLGRIGMDARAIQRTGVAAADEVAVVGCGDAVVLLAYSHVAPHVDALLRHAAAVGVPVVLLTDHLAPPPGDSIVLRTGRGQPGGAASHVTTVAMLEALALMAAEQDPARSTARLDEVNRLRDHIAQRTGQERRQGRGDGHR